jgi:acetyltransferase
VRTWTLQTQSIFCRDRYSSDFALYRGLRNGRKLTQTDRHARFQCGVAAPDRRQLACMTQIDYAREMCFVVERHDASNGTTEIIGECRMVADPDNVAAEIAMSVRSDCQRQTTSFGHDRALMLQA